MITVNINMDGLKAKLAHIKALRENPDPVLRTVALAILPEMRHRVHVDGLDSAGNKIGTYTPEYMRIRTGDYGNSKRVTRGKNKGKLKDAGRYTKRVQEDPVGEKREGTLRPQYNRTNDTKVVLSLTRQMENDESVVDTPNGYGIGFQNPHNYEKAIWCEEIYDKPILTQLARTELDIVPVVANGFTDKYLKSGNTLTGEEYLGQ